MIEIDLEILENRNSFKCSCLRLPSKQTGQIFKRSFHSGLFLASRGLGWGGKYYMYDVFVFLILFLIFFIYFLDILFSFFLFS